MNVCWPYYVQILMKSMPLQPISFENAIKPTFIVELRDSVLYTCCNYRILLQTCLISLPIKKKCTFINITMKKSKYQHNGIEKKHDKIIIFQD